MWVIIGYHGKLTTDRWKLERGSTSQGTIETTANMEQYRYKGAEEDGTQLGRRYDTIRYDTIHYIYLHPKADE